MNETETKTVSLVKMSDKVFQQLGEYIHSGYGIKMPPSKKVLLEARLQKRLRHLGMASFKEYYEYLFSPHGEEEIIHMIDLVTTNKTDFFREPRHFEYLSQIALPELVNTRQAGFRRPLLLWSAGCSSGDEPYTLAMVLSEFAHLNPGFTFSILATDLSTKVLEKAREGIYDEEKVDPVPLALRKKYLLKSKDQTKQQVRIVQTLRSKIEFRKLNLMDNDFRIKKEADIIFCRNVVIYFNKKTQENLLHKFSRCLTPDGYLFMGHSETLTGLDVPFIPVAPTIYRKSTWGV